MRKLGYLLLLLFLFVACEQASNTVITAPNAAVDCQITECNGALNGRTAFVILTRSGCSNADFDPVASGSTSVSCDANGCTGVVSSWVDANSNSVTEIISGNHDVCAYIDVNGNTSQDTGDVESDSSQSISSSETVVIDSWSVR
ncbi:MAG: hypothetical protein HRT44_11095 [Bdellovibrionales bacterium]|nr:hypothetical protein [Bdellovibrionales bacterium]NQZ19786.1 hypothetical protein [Bdellovibrionales bacterium]